MTERPILMSAPMVRALLAGTKTQTRRIVKPQPERKIVPCHYTRTGWALEGSPNEQGVTGCSCLAVRACPYDADRLWVRETWARDDEDGCMMYRADLRRDMNADCWEQGRLEGVPRYRWRPSIHMPRWASRITLEINDVRVERLQEISEADAIAEGMIPTTTARALHGESLPSPAYTQYADLWDSINGPGSWALNPWVWVVCFKRLP